MPLYIEAIEKGEDDAGVEGYLQIIYDHYKRRAEHTDWKEGRHAVEAMKILMKTGVIDPVHGYAGGV